MHNLPMNLEDIIRSKSSLELSSIGASHYHVLNLLNCVIRLFKVDDLFIEGEMFIFRSHMIPSDFFLMFHGLYMSQFIWQDIGWLLITCLYIVSNTLQFFLRFTSIFFYRANRINHDQE